MIGELGFVPGGVLFFLFFVLPFVLRSLTFIVLSEFFWVVMLVSTFVLGCVGVGSLLVGFVSGVLLCVVFWVGDLVSGFLGLGRCVDLVYGLVYTFPGVGFLVVGLVWIGVMEEIYWRGGLQGLLREMNLGGHVLVASIIYSMVHVVTFNPILVIAAFIVGLILGIVAEKVGIVGSIIGHTLWLELILVIFPVR